MATADATSDGAGLITIAFEPRLRFSPLDSAVVYVEDGVLPKPRGVFMLSNPENQWSARPGEPNKRIAIGLVMTEDVFATQ